MSKSLIVAVPVIVAGLLAGAVTVKLVAAAVLMVLTLVLLVGILGEYSNG